MRTTISFVSVTILLLLGVLPVLPVTSSHATEGMRDHQLAVPGQGVVLHSSGRLAAAKASADTFYIYGGPNTLEGQFQTEPGVPGGAPDPQGWTPVDQTELAPFWRASTTNSSSTGDGNPTGFSGGVGNHSVISHHDGLDYVGYGNNWNDWLVFTYEVSAGNPGFNPAVDVTSVRYLCEYKHDIEELYDYLNFEWNRGGVYQSLLRVDQSSYNDTTAFYEKRDFDSDLHGGISYGPGDYIDGSTIQLRIRITSDGGWSDEDGIFSSSGRGAAAIDNIVVYVNGSPVSLADWEPLSPKADLPEGDVSGHNNGTGPGSSGWLPTPSTFAGSFAKIFAWLEDLDECRDNFSYQWTFINDGTPPNNCPGCPIAPSISAQWTYGVPGGYVVNYTGGLTNGLTPVNESLRSPEIDWDLPGPEDDVANGGAVLGFSVYEHSPVTNGIFNSWSVRSYGAADGWTGWEDRSFVYFSNSPRYVNRVLEVGDLLAPDRERIQISLNHLDLAMIFAFPGNDATPSPYYDNVYLKKYVIGGPSIVTRTIDLASDCFPVDGTLTGSCRFDANIDRNSFALVPGDSITADITAIILGTSLLDPTVGGVMEVAHLMNPDFTPQRAAAMASVGATLVGTDPQSGWEIYTYSVQGQEVISPSGGILEGRYSWDLPDGSSNGLPHIADEDPIFFPGDVIHYYLRAEDNMGNVSTLPDDTTGFTDFTEGTAYDRVQTVRGLPTLHQGSQPSLLFWNDFGHRGAENEYLQAFRQNGMLEGVNYDTYTTKGPSSGVGNGLGSAGYHGANAGQLAGYDYMIYALGNLSSISISDGAGVGSNDLSADLATVEAWANADADRYHAYFGDSFAQSMVNQGAACQSYLNTILGVDFLGSDVGPSIDDQIAATVVPSGSGSGAFVGDFVSYGGCLVINDFDEIGPVGVGPIAAHEFTQPDGIPYPGGIGASIEWLRVDGGGNFKHSIVFPYDLRYVRADMNGIGGGGTSARAHLLGEVFASWGRGPLGPPLGTQDLPSKLFVDQNYPNPFNPSTTIQFALPARAQVSVKVYNVRGELVATLQDGIMDAGPQSVVWGGRDATGSSVSSGVYLYKVQSAGVEIVKKMALIK